MMLSRGGGGVVSNVHTLSIVQSHWRRPSIEFKYVILMVGKEKKNLRCTVHTVVILHMDKEVHMSC